MRCRLHVRYRKAGVLYPAGAVIEAEEEDLSILGSLARLSRKPRLYRNNPPQARAGAGSTRTRAGEPQAAKTHR